MLSIFCLIVLGVAIFPFDSTSAFHVTKANHYRLTNYKKAESSAHRTSHGSPKSMTDLSARRRRSPQSLPAPMPPMPPMPMPAPPEIPGRRRRSLEEYAQEMNDQFSSQYQLIPSEMSDVTVRKRRSPQGIPAPMPPMPPMPSPPEIPGKRRRSLKDYAQQMNDQFSSQYQITPSGVSDVTTRKRRSPQGIPAPMPAMPSPPEIPGKRRRSLEDYAQQMNDQFSSRYQITPSGVSDVTSRKRRSPQGIPAPMPPMPPMPSPPEIPGRRRRSLEMNDQFSTQNQILSEMSDVDARKRRSPQGIPAPMPPMPAPPEIPGRKRRSLEDNAQESSDQFSSQYQILSEMSEVNERKRRSPQDFPLPMPPLPIPELPSRRRRSPEDAAGKLKDKKQQAQDRAKQEGSEAKEKVGEVQGKAREAGEAGKAMAESAKGKLPSVPRK